ncbi:Cyanohydrin beta-glucosyltransferase [Handroanthus impetiginosus]|uniref:Cyanohydrin beta-glucosyltransferase n=1 Tax=Handroanthus impetiginosus TaxID=429701 RepID=A0A2G9H0G8_9LAMI|nr:Cyanohydrin beta-glucosyltransferase [Handroanthus impetiginosus]
MNQILFSFKLITDSTCLTNGYLDTAVDCIPSLKNIRLRELPSFIRTTNINDPILNFAALTPLCPSVYIIGPVHLSVSKLPEDSLKYLGSNLWKEQSECLHWLDSRKPNSVIYLNFGSIKTLKHEQITELAWGLANSNKHFLWIIRPCWLTNCRFVCEEWGVGMEIGEDVRRDEVERVVREVVGGDYGEKMKKRAMEWKGKVEEAVGGCGSTFLNLDSIENRDFRVPCHVLRTSNLLFHICLISYLM